MFYVQFYVSLQEGAVLRVLISYLILLKISIDTGHNWMPLNIWYRYAAYVANLYRKHIHETWSISIQSDQPWLQQVGLLRQPLVLWYFNLLR
jgi:hypothetical protein